MKLTWDQLKTPIGALVFVVDEVGCLRALNWSTLSDTLRRSLGPAASEATLVRERNPFGVTKKLGAYFEGDVRVIDDLAAEGHGTPFQRQVWSALRKIECGTTISYAELARRINNPKAVRAVGLANGANPISLVVPCHRVIGANGSLTGYGGGLERKRWFLTHEGATANLSLAL